MIAAGFALVPIFVAVQSAATSTAATTPAPPGSAARCCGRFRHVGMAVVDRALLGLHHAAWHRPHVPDGVAADADACAVPRRGREIAFGHFMVAISFGQGLGPIHRLEIGGGVTVPPTGPLFFLGRDGRLCLAVSFAIGPTGTTGRTDENGNVTRCRAAAGARNVRDHRRQHRDRHRHRSAGHLSAAARHRTQIEAHHIGMLLLVRSLSALVARAFYARLIFMVGRCG